MKRIKLMAPTTCQILTGSVFLIHIINLVASQTSIEPHEHNELVTGVSRETRALKLSTKSSNDDDTACPHCNILPEMPMELAEKINAIDDVDVFIHDFVDYSNSLSNMSSIHQDRISRRRRAARDSSLKQATCQPIDTIVSLIPPEEKDPTIFYFPSCILVKQCGGCCAHSGTTCSPTDESDKQVTIKKTKYTGGNKLQAMGEVTVNVKEHKKCRCQCKKTASDCNSLQKFIANQCRCECLNIQEAEECAKDSTKLWDTKSCACVCRDEKDCATGLQFDQSSCSCQPITDDGETHDFDFGDHSYHETYEATDDTKYETVPGH